MQEIYATMNPDMSGHYAMLLSFDFSYPIKDFSRMALVRLKLTAFSNAIEFLAFSQLMLT